MGANYGLVLLHSCVYHYYSANLMEITGRMLVMHEESTDARWAEPLALREATIITSTQIVPIQPQTYYI